MQSTSQIFMKILPGVAASGGLLYYAFNKGEKLSNDQCMSRNIDDDPSLRRVEKDKMIPMVMKQIANEDETLCKLRQSDMTACWHQMREDGYSKYSNITTVAEVCKKPLAALHKCYEENYHNQELYWKAKQMYLDDKVEFTKTGVTKKTRVQIQDFVKENKTIATVHLRTSEKQYVVKVIKEQEKEDIYGELLEHLNTDIAERVEFAKNAAILNTGHKCTNIYCKCGGKQEEST